MLRRFQKEASQAHRSPNLTTSDSRTGKDATFFRIKTKIMKKKKKQEPIAPQCNKKETCLCLQCKSIRVTELLGCTCSSCQPKLYCNIDSHPQDRVGFNHYTGLQRRGHDAWLLATYLVDRLNAQWQPDTTRIALTCWKHWKAAHTQENSIPTSDELTRQDLQDIANILNEVFFMGQLPESRCKIYWDELGTIFGQTFWTGETQIILLNLKSGALNFSLEKVVQVMLHEMIHAYFGCYACFPWIYSKCAQGTCGKLWHGNIGWSGHGRAWQYVAKEIELAMPKLLGIRGDLGRMDGLCTDSKGSSWALPCLKAAREIYPWEANPLWWERYLRTRDDDLICDSILKKVRKKTESTEAAHGTQTRPRCWSFPGRANALRT